MARVSTGTGVGYTGVASNRTFFGANSDAVGGPGVDIRPPAGPQNGSFSASFSRSFSGGV